MTWNFPTHKVLPCGRLIDMLATMSMVGAWGEEDNMTATKAEADEIYTQLLAFGEQKEHGVPDHIWDPRLQEHLSWSDWLRRNGARFVLQEN